MVPILSYIEACGNREITFRFRGQDYFFSLSHGLFSSAGIDSGSRFLLKVFSDSLDSGGSPGNLFQGEAPCSVLDAGCGTGVLGICAAGALSAYSPPAGFHVRFQDRDELARVFTEHNARRNGFREEIFSVHTEPLLAGPAGQKWNLILTNIPAKAGLPVLEDFVSRSAAVLKKDGRVFLVAVNTLADFFRSSITAAGAPLLTEVTGKEHTVFVYGAAKTTAEISVDNKYGGGPLIFDESFPRSYPFYIRNQNEYEMEDLSYRMDTVHGAPDFDSPGGATQAAAKLAVKFNLASRLAANDTGNNAMLVYDAGQGHFPLWLVHYLTKSKAAVPPIVLSGRNILALAAARAALTDARSALAAAGATLALASPVIIPSADIFLDRERLGEAANVQGMKSGSGFDFIAYFPEIVPETNRDQAAWEGLTLLAQPGCIVISGMNSAEAERFDRKKPPEWNRLGDIKRKGFRALAYSRKQE